MKAQKGREGGSQASTIRKMKLEFARPALSAWGRGDNPRRRSPAQNIPLNLLRVLTPSPASLCFTSGKPSDHNLVQTTWLRALPETRRAIVQPNWKETRIPAPRTPLPSAAWY